MKLEKSWKSIIFISAIIFTNTVLAVTPSEDEERKDCKKPKFREVVPAHTAEVLPESELSFHISRGADPHSVTAEVKGEKVPLTVRDRISFMTAIGKLPADLREGYARVHITAKAVDGGCMGQDGWLIKFKSADSASIPADKAEK